MTPGTGSDPCVIIIRADTGHMLRSLGDMASVSWGRIPGHCELMTPLCTSMSPRSPRIITQQLAWVVMQPVMELYLLKTSSQCPQPDFHQSNGNDIELNKHLAVEARRLERAFFRQKRVYRKVPKPKAAAMEKAQS